MKSKESKESIKPESTMPTTASKKLQPVEEKNLLKRERSLAELDKAIKYLNEGKFYLFQGADVLDFKEGIDWEYEHPHSTATYQVYLHSLDIVNYLCNQYKKTKETYLLEKSLNILNDWMEYDKSDPKNPPEKMWYDHPAACRALTITFFYVLAKNTLTLDEGVIYDCLVKHAQFLYQDEIYRPNNHGIMMDRALLLTSIVLAQHNDAKKWQNRALARLKEAFNRDFSFKGTHLENSPDYHIIVMKLFKSTEKFLKKNNLSLGKEFRNRLKQAENYFQYLAKPDKTLPMLGDSSSVAKIRAEKKFDDFLDIQAGIAIVQQLNKKKPDQSTWLTFICGYGSKTHKHRDDLSFNLFWQGKDIFIDSGKYNYDIKNKYRAYVISPMAHNTVTIENWTYRLDAPQVSQNNISITDFISNSVYSLIKGKNLNYKGKEIYRTLIFLKPDIIIIFDKILGKSKAKALQLFNLAPSAKITELKENSVSISIGDDEIEMISLLDIDDIKIYFGDRKLPRGIMSQKFAQLTDISQIEISKKGTNLEFLTLIKLGDPTNLPKISYDRSLSLLTITTDDKDFNLIL